VFRVEIWMDKWPLDIIELGTVIEVGYVVKMVAPNNITWFRVVSLSKQQFTQDYIRNINRLTT